MHKICNTADIVVEIEKCTVCANPLQYSCCCIVWNRIRAEHGHICVFGQLHVLPAGCVRICQRASRAFDAAQVITGEIPSLSLAIHAAAVFSQPSIRLFISQVERDCHGWCMSRRWLHAGRLSANHSPFMLYAHLFKCDSQIAVVFISFAFLRS
jgi:hypothetical protein